MDISGHPLRDGLSPTVEPVPVSPVPASIPDAHILTLWQKTKGKAWEPIDYRHPYVERLIAGGFIVRCAMRCGFEAFNTGVDWTPAGKIAAKAIEASKETP